IDDTILITAATGDTSTPATGASSTALTGVTLTLQDPSMPTPTVLFTISAGSAVYTTFSSTVTSTQSTAGGLSVRDDLGSWLAGDKLLVLENVSFTIGTYVSFSADKIEIHHYANGTVVVNNFNLKGATVSFLDDGVPMASLTGDAQFRHVTGSPVAANNGFKLISFANPGVGFMGQTAELPVSTTTSPAAVTAANPTGTVANYGVPRKLGPLTLVSPFIKFHHFNFDFSGNVSAQITIGAVSATIGVGPVSASFNNISGTFEVGLKFDLSNLTAGPTGGSVEFLNIKATSLSVTLGSYVTLSATNVTIRPNASANEELASFGSITATLNINAIALSGSASNFAILGDGSFLAKTNFGITIELGKNGNADATSLQWPAWMPLKSASVSLVWRDFNVDPADFLIQLSAEVDTTIGVIAISGSVTNAVIDPQLLFEGKFPIISIDGLAIGASGNLFGGSISGTLTAGVIRFDPTGRMVDGLGNYTGTSVKATGAITNVFYAGIQAGFEFAGMAGFNIRIGLSDFGPLQIY
ncbi:hypothetical protein, partial [Prosthecobacter sp.]|uniref:hypothetical protein n=1 Tax=Prosthecobacter sp. TaxID=1965333 RepID=UPI002488627E